MKTKTYVRLRSGQKRRAGYQYRYKEARGWTPWLSGGDEFLDVRITGGNGAQYRAPRLRK